MPIGAPDVLLRDRPGRVGNQGLNPGQPWSRQVSCSLDYFSSLIIIIKLTLNQFLLGCHISIPVSCLECCSPLPPECQRARQTEVQFS